MADVFRLDVHHAVTVLVLERGEGVVPDRTHRGGVMVPEEEGTVVGLLVQGGHGGSDELWRRTVRVEEAARHQESVRVADQVMSLAQATRHPHALI
jgi:hypothetical protein